MGGYSLEHVARMPKVVTNPVMNKARSIASFMKFVPFVDLLNIRSAICESNPPAGQTARLPI